MKKLKVEDLGLGHQWALAIENCGIQDRARVRLVQAFGPKGPNV